MRTAGIFILILSWSPIFSSLAIILNHSNTLSVLLSDSSRTHFTCAGGPTAYRSVPFNVFDKLALYFTKKPFDKVRLNIAVIFLVIFLIFSCLLMKILRYIRVIFTFSSSSFLRQATRPNVCSPKSTGHKEGLINTWKKSQCPILSSRIVAILRFALLMDTVFVLLYLTALLLSHRKSSISNFPNYIQISIFLITVLAKTHSISK